MGLAITPRQRQRRNLWRELHRVAQDDLRAVADEIALLQDREDDAYYEAVAMHRDAEEKLATARTLVDLRAVASLTSRARGALAGAVDVPACFFDPAHGPSARQVVFAPDGGAMRQVPACEACAEEVDAGRAPDLRRVIVNGRPQPYWRSPVHSGYFGYGADTLDGLMVTVAMETAFDASSGLLDLLTDLFDPTDLL